MRFFLLGLFLACGSTLAANRACPVQVVFPEARFAPRPIVGIAGRTGFIYDTTAGYDAIGPGDDYTGNRYGSREAQWAIQRYRLQKNFSDGILDIFVVVLGIDDREPAPALSHAWGIVNFFGTIPGLAGRNGPRGMARNPENRRHVRLFVLDAAYRSTDVEVPFPVLQMGADIARDFRTEVAVSSGYVRFAEDGRFLSPGGWVHFSPPPATEENP